MRQHEPAIGEAHPGRLPGGVGRAEPAGFVVHVAQGLSRYVTELRRAGITVPTEVDELAALLLRVVTPRLDTDSSRLGTTSLDSRLPPPHAARMADRLLLTKREAAGRLGVSERTVDRLIASGRLPLVHVERAARLRVSDVEDYVQGLREAPAPLAPRSGPQ